METQDHLKPKQSGIEGSSGSVHVCHKCGWPFPKPHPSAKHRRAHKRVCGTIDGYKLDIDAQDKTHLMEGSDGEHVSDDELKTPSAKVVETTISRRSNSGVGSRSSRSTRSEDEVFTDAVTDFIDTPSPGEASDGIQRFYSMQRVTQNDLDDIKHAADKAEADSLSARSIFLNDNQDHVRPVQKLEGENDRVEPGVLFQDHIPSSTFGPALSSHSITLENENEGDTANEIISSTEKSELRTSYNETTEEASEDVSVLRDVDEEIVVPVSASGIAKSVMETTGSENNIECSQAVEHPAEVIDPANGSSTKPSDVIVDYGSKSEADADVYVLAVPDALLLQEHPEIAVEDLDHKRSKFNTLMTLGSGTGTGNAEYGEYGIAHAAEEVFSGIDLTKTSDSKKVYSEGDVLESFDAMENKLNQYVGHKSISEQNPVGEEPVQLPDVEVSDGHISEVRSVVSDFKTENLEEQISNAEEQKPIVALNNVFPEGDSSAVVNNPEFTINEATNTEHVVLQESDDIEVSGSLLLPSDVDISEFRSEVFSDFKTENLEEKSFSCAEEQKPTIAMNNVFPESASSVAADNAEFTSNGASSTRNGVKNNTEHVVLHNIDDSEVSGSLLLAEHAINVIPPQFKELSNIHDISDTGNDETIGVVQTHLDGSEIRSGVEDNVAVNAETAPGFGSNAAGSRDGIHEPFEVDRFHDHVNSEDSGDVFVGHSLPMVESTGGSSAGAEFIGEEGPGSISKTKSTDASEVCDDAQCSLQSSAAVNDTCMKKFTEDASGVVDGDRVVKPHIAISGADILPDSSSQTDSLEGNWGSVSVMSAVSDTPPANDTPASNQSAAKDHELKPMMESQNSESKKPVEPHSAIGAIEGVSEIQTLEEQKENKKTSWSSSVAHVDNAPHGGKRNEEIIAKVTNWSTEKQHMPLKALLGEATARSRAESPIHTLQSDETSVANNGNSKSENVILSSDNPTSEASKEEMGKEWNSPARYPVNIKTEKRKGKSKPYWAPFLCCSSVNAR
ncbi:uncharacterized protein [Spinacia oleracea]|uniref:C2H2-type domain-containing protein n=1 Tax=Spinacia oleracea TaxID=3562 RepID=A0A9R0J3S8_SPIOL|nr:uncharacterized protein LOC110799730 [Spinacia oleracea]